MGLQPQISATDEAESRYFAMIHGTRAGTCFFHARIWMRSRFASAITWHNSIILLEPSPPLRFQGREGNSPSNWNVIDRNLHDYCHEVLYLLLLFFMSRFRCHHRVPNAVASAGVLTLRVSPQTTLGRSFAGGTDPCFALFPFLFPKSRKRFIIPPRRTTA